jgi:rhamnose transport system permease protein
MSFLSRYRREISVLAAYLLLLAALALFAPGFFYRREFRATWIDAAPIIVAAVGMTLVIIAREIDISIGSQFSICAVLAALAFKSGMPMPLAAGVAVGAGAIMGAFNGMLIAFAGLPSIVVTLATMVILRYSLTLARQGAAVNELPDGFQWFGFTQRGGESALIIVELAMMFFFAAVMRWIAAGRAVYAVGSDREAARLAGVRPKHVIFWVFVLMGALAGVAALLGAVRLPDVDPNYGKGLELQVIAAVVVGGTAISGGRGTLIGTLIGVALLMTVAPALQFFHMHAQWEKAVQGAIILLAVSYDGLLRREA